MDLELTIDSSCAMGTLIIYLSTCTLCLCFFLFLVRFFYQVWWTPIRIRSMFKSQGIKGPSYKFYDGNSKEITNMGINASSNPIELSNHLLFPTVLPHIYSWSKIYGNSQLALSENLSTVVSKLISYSCYQRLLYFQVTRSLNSFRDLYPL